MVTAGTAYILAVRDPCNPAVILAGVKYGRPAGVYQYPNIDAFTSELAGNDFCNARCHSSKKVNSPFGSGKQPLLPRVVILGRVSIADTHAEFTGPLSAYKVMHVAGYRNAHFLSNCQSAVLWHDAHFLLIADSQYFGMMHIFR